MCRGAALRHVRLLLLAACLSLHFEGVSPTVSSNCTSLLSTAWQVSSPLTPGWQPAYGVPSDYRQLGNASVLQQLSGCVGGCSALVNTFQCNSIPDFIEDTFGDSELNLTNWQPSGSFPYNYSINPVWAAGVGGSTLRNTTAIFTPWGVQMAGTVLDHCPSAGAVGAASAATCTALSPANLQTGIDLSVAAGYAPAPGAADTSVLGATMTLSQEQCINSFGINNPDCCSRSVNAKTGLVSTVCASWAGAHLASQWCAQYGVVEAEAAFNMPSAGGAYMFFGSFIMGAGNSTTASGTTVIGDQAWNEVDELITNSTTDAYGTPCGVGGACGGAPSMPTYGTALFIGKASSGSGAVQNIGNEAGLSSSHDASGTCGQTPNANGVLVFVNRTCTTNNPSPTVCPAAPLEYPLSNATLVQGGMPASVAGGQGCPVYTQATMSTFHNYKLVWTPSWISWVVRIFAVASKA